MRSTYPEKTARFCFPELRLGIIPCFGGLPRLKRQCGTHVIQDLLFTGRSIHAKRAHELGLVSQVVGNGQGLDVARRVAEQISHFPQAVISPAKNFIKQVPYAELEQEMEIFFQLTQNQDLENALDKFIADKSAFSYQP